jgi:hypothetical protein
MAASKKLIERAALNRIIKGVGKEFRPADIDLDGLLRGLDKCIEFYEEARKHSTNKYLKSEKKQLRVVLARAKRLQQLMKHDDLCRLAVSSIVSLVKYELAERGHDPQGQYYQLTFQVHNPIELLFGDWLPVLYREAGFLRGNSPQMLASKDGPYIAFAKQIAKELFRSKVLGRQYAVTTLIKAVNNVASPPASRRRVPIDDPGDVEFFEWAAEDRRDDVRLIMAPTRIQMGQK